MLAGKGVAESLCCNFALVAIEAGKDVTQARIWTHICQKQAFSQFG